MTHIHKYLPCVQPVIDAIDSISVEYLATLDRMARVPPDDEDDQLTTSYERLEALIDYNQVCLLQIMYYEQWIIFTCVIYMIYKGMINF